MLLVILVLNTILLMNDTATLEVQVVGPDGKGIPFAKVSVWDNVYQTYVPFTTDATGYGSLGGYVINSTIKVTGMQTGYVTMTTTVSNWDGSKVYVRLPKSP